MKIVISNPKTSKAYSKETDGIVFLGKKIGDELQLDSIGLNGYSAKITGGSDKQGFPMRFDLQGTGRKKVLLSRGPGFNPEEKGERKRITVRGNTISEEIQQVNVKILKEGEKNLEELMPKTEKKEEKKEEPKKEAKKDKK